MLKMRTATVNLISDNAVRVCAHVCIDYFVHTCTTTLLISFICHAYLPQYYISFIWYGEVQVNSSYVMNLICVHSTGYHKLCIILHWIIDITVWDGYKLKKESG
jgi:hypothetical protein